MLFIRLPSGRTLSYVKPRIGENLFGGQSVTYEGVGSAKKWERIESYGPKFVENIVQAISRDILCYAMRTLSHCFICGHVHDELIIECSKDISLETICSQMSRTPPWLPGINLNADGYTTAFYRKIQSHKFLELILGMIKRRILFLLQFCYFLLTQSLQLLIHKTYAEIRRIASELTVIAATVKSVQEERDEIQYRIDDLYERRASVNGVLEQKQLEV